MAANDCQSQRRWMLMLTRTTQWTLDWRSGKNSRCSKRSFSSVAGSEEGSLASLLKHDDRCWWMEWVALIPLLAIVVIVPCGPYWELRDYILGSEMAQNQEQSPAKKCQGATFTVGGYSYKIGNYFLIRCLSFFANIVN